MGKHSRNRNNKASPQPREKSEESKHGRASKNVFDYLKPPYENHDGKIFSSLPHPVNVLDVRGWGHFTGNGGGLGMSEDEAVVLLDNFGDHVAKAIGLHALLDASGPQVLERLRENLEGLKEVLEECEADDPDRYGVETDDSRTMGLLLHWVEYIIKSQEQATGDEDEQEA